MFLLICPKIQIVTLVSLRQPPELRAEIARKREETVLRCRRQSGDADTADHDVHSEENESRQHRYAVVVQDLLYWIQSNPTKKENQD